MFKLSRLFGESGSAHLLQAFEHGFAPASASKILLKAGILGTARVAGEHRVILDHRHPAAGEICELLQASGVQKRSAARGTFVGTHTISPADPLGVRGHYRLRIFATLLKFGPLSREHIQDCNRDVWGQRLFEQANILVRSGFLVDREAIISIAPEVPSPYLRFVEKVWAALEGTDYRFPAFTDAMPTSRPWAYKSAEDGAPRIFGTDARLRHLMALAKYGRLHLLEIRRIVGKDATHRDDRDNAPLTRAGLTLTWGTSPDHAAMLDPRFPLHDPLRRFLLAMEKAYPLPPYIPARPAPAPPKIDDKWKGDRYWLFGGKIPTAILTSIGVLGWTFEALCVPLATGHDRVVIKKSLKRLEEDDHVLQGDRARKPGMNVRVITVAADFPAREELLELLKAYVQAWPAIRDAVGDAMRRLPPKTQAHLKKRGLVSS